MTSSSSIHTDHCSVCYSIHCEEINCPLQQCSHCRMEMHECKIEEHEEICTKCMVRCLNASYGCPFTIRRDLQYKHLETCPASSVVCSSERSRACLDKAMKKELKLIGKRRQESSWSCLPSSSTMDIDECLARYDQDLVIDTYCYSRKDRVRRRDRLHIREPNLPLRPIFEYDFYNGLEQNHAVEVQEENDSSDEEKKIEDAKMKKKKAMFDHCYQCQVDPSVQHFHTLGRDDARWDLLMARRNRLSWKTIDPFYLPRKLMLSIHVDKIPETVRRSDNIQLIRNGGTIYTRRCLCSIPRSEINLHMSSQHTVGGDSNIDSLIVRCPLWYLGCSFTTSRISPVAGHIRFLPDIGAFTYRPKLEFESPVASQDDCPLATLPPWAFLEISQYLSGVALNALVMTSMWMREIVFSHIAPTRGLVSLDWKKTEKGKWEYSPTSLKWTFPMTEINPSYVFTPCTGTLSTHLAQCQYREPCPLPDFAKRDLDLPYAGMVPSLPDPPFSTVVELTNAGCFRDIARMAFTSD